MIEAPAKRELDFVKSTGEVFVTLAIFSADVSTRDANPNLAATAYRFALE